MVNQPPGVVKCHSGQLSVLPGSNTAGAANNRLSTMPSDMPAAIDLEEA